MATNSKSTTTLSIDDSSADFAPAEYARRPAAPARTGRLSPLLLGGLLQLLLVPAFVALGLWQWDKAERKTALQAELDQRSHEAAIALSAAPAATETLRYRRVTLRGQYDAGHQVLIDNQLYREQAGYHVVTPLRLAGSPLHVLVNRGWLPAPAEHARLPPAPVPAGEVEVTGIAVPPPERFFNLAPQPGAGWAAVWQNLDIERYRAVLGQPLQPVIVQLDPAAPGGFVRDWPRPDERAERHRSYALQWFGFALASLGIWGFFLIRQPAPERPEAAPPPAQRPPGDEQRATP